MLNTIVHSFFHCNKRPNYLQIPLAGLMLMVGISSGNANAIQTSVSGDAATSHQNRVIEAKSASLPEVASSNTRTTGSVKQISDGIYLYGQSAQPEQIGQEYIVFEVRGDRAIGALYMPRSEFSCFQGTLRARQLNVTLANPDSEIAESSPDPKQEFQPVAVGSTSPPSGNRFDAVTFPLSVKLQNYHQIPRVSENDQRILSMCKANY
ncbi:hypothetical protein [Argonema antarcticum]|uniref:hypothetical protein n=1 Tax=Argonema antarcticum TaxID=2942763 RepID=UPI002012828A|nr:hypothetical protein [Argonema antarcticum]MCL1470257.1 hypothetical protein [Argonema antarcticum A004/B2]